MNKLTLDDLECNGKKVLMRVDFNVPFNEKGEIADNTRIRAAIPSIQKVLEEGGAVIVMSHLGRPKGKKVESLSLRPCAKSLSELLGIEVKMAPDCVGEEVEKLVEQLRSGEILLLENLRFHRAEKHPEEDLTFAKKLASLADFYVNDAFGTCHREHASCVTITQHFLGKSAAGYLLNKEVGNLTRYLADPKKPYVALIGGAKISTKIEVLESLIGKVDTLLIGGAMACTFLKAQGYSMGDSMVEETELSTAKRILEYCQSSNVHLILPVDLIVTKRIDANSPQRLVSLEREGVVRGWKAVDIGPATTELFSKALEKAKTIFWNGPLGVFEVPQFAKGTYAIAEVIAKSLATTVVGGGDSVSAVRSLSLQDQITHLSTGGGASLKFIERGTLPALEVLSEKHVSYFTF